jgi:hypothetical protein
MESGVKERWMALLAWRRGDSLPAGPLRLYMPSELPQCVGDITSVVQDPVLNPLL